MCYYMCTKCFSEQPGHETRPHAAMPPGSRLGQQIHILPNTLLFNEIKLLSIDKVYDKHTCPDHPDHSVGPTLGELAPHSSSCHHLVTIWVGETWNQKLLHVPPLPPTRSLSHLKTAACETDHLHKKQWNKDSLKIEMLFPSKTHNAETERKQREWED